MLENAAFWGASCAVVWGISDFIARFAGRSVGAMAATFALMMVGAVLIAAAMGITGQDLILETNGLHYLLGIGSATAIGSILFYHAVTHGPVTVAAPVVACYPAIAMPISVILGARPSVISWVAMAVTLAGVWLVARMAAPQTEDTGDGTAGAEAVPGGKKTSEKFSPAVIRRTALLAFLAAAIYASALATAADQAAAIYGPLQTVLVMRIVGAIIVTIAVFSLKEKMRFPLRAWPLLIAFGVLDTAGHLFIFIGLGLENGEYAIVTSVAYTAITVLLASFFLRERLTLGQWSGVTLVIAGVALLAIFG
jgi:drug/metabolite transporter (DMT)-like permease